MSRRLSRISLALVFLLASEAWALGLGEIKLNSALNEPLNAEIELNGVASAPSPAAAELLINQILFAIVKFTVAAAAAGNTPSEIS